MKESMQIFEARLEITVERTAVRLYLNRELLDVGASGP